MDNTSKGRLGGEGELGVMYKKLSKDVKTNEEEFVDKLVYQQFDVEELEVRRPLSSARFATGR